MNQTFPICKCAIPTRLLKVWRQYIHKDAVWYVEESEGDAVLTLNGKNAERLLQQFLIANFPAGKIVCFTDAESSYVIDADGDLIAFSSL